MSLADVADVLAKYNLVRSLRAVGKITEQNRARQAAKNVFDGWEKKCSGGKKGQNIS